MAFVFKNRNTKNWIAGFRDPSGRRRNRSTGLPNTEKNRRQAERIADQYEAAANRKRTAQQVRRTIAELHKEITGDDLPVVTMRSHVEQWLESKASSVSPGTLGFYKGATDKFLAYLKKRADADLGDIVREDIEGFRDSLAKRLAPKTVNHQIKVLRMLFNDARDRALLADDPTEFVKTVKARKVVKRRPFTIGEVRAVLEHCNAEWRSIVLFGLYTGQRLGDIARLRWESIDLERESVTLTTSKTGRQLNLPLHPDLSAHLRSLPRPISGNVPVHPEACATVEAEGKVGSLSNRFARILAAAGLREKKSHRSTGKGRDAQRDLNGLSFHSLRRTAATVLHEIGVPQSVAMAFIGHDSEDIHAIYVNVGEEAMRTAAAKIPSVL